MNKNIELRALALGMNQDAASAALVVDDRLLPALLLVQACGAVLVAVVGVAVARR